MASSQTVGQNVAVAPQAFVTAVPNNYNVGSSDVNGISQRVDNFQHQVLVPEQKPGVYSKTQTSTSQNISKPNLFASSVSSANAGYSSSKYVNGVQANAGTASNFQGQLGSTEQQTGHYLGFNSNVPEPQSISQGNVFVSTESAVSDSQSPKDVNGALVSADTTSTFHGLVENDQKPGLYSGSNQHTFGSQHILRPDGFISGVVSKRPEKFNEPSTIQSVSSQVINSGSVGTVSTVQDQATQSVEKKPIYSSGFGGPPGVLNPYDKASTSGVNNNVVASYQPNQKPSDYVNTKPQTFFYTPVNNVNPSYSFQQQQQQTGDVKPNQSLSINYATPNTQSSYKPDIKPTKANENTLSYVQHNERPSSELKPTNDAQLTGSKYVNQRPEVEYSQSSKFGVDYASHDIQSEYHSFNKEQPREPSQTGVQYDTSYIATESAEKPKPTKEPSYTGGFGAPAGVFKPIQATLSGANKFASTTVKQWQETAKPYTGFTATGTEVNKYSSHFEETNPTQKPAFESTSYQSFDIGSSPASYVTLKPTISDISHSEQYIQTSSFGTPSNVETIKQKGEDQSVPKPTESSPVNPTLSPWAQNPTQASTFVKNPEVINPAIPVAEISSQYKPINANVFGLSTTTKPSSLQVYEQFPSSSHPWGYDPSDVSGSVDKTKPNKQLVSSYQNTPSQSGTFADQLEVQKPFYQPFYSGRPINQVSFDKTKPSVEGKPTDISAIPQQPTNKPSIGGSLDNTPVELNESQKPISNTFNNETPSKLSNLFSGNTEPQSQKKPTAINQNKPFYSSTFGTLTGSTGYISSSSNSGQYGFATVSNDKVSQSSQILSTDLNKHNVGTEKPSFTTGVTSGSTIISHSSSGGLTSSSIASTSPSQKPTYQSISDSYSVTGSVSQNSNTQKHTENTFVPEKTSSEQQKFTNQQSTFGSKPQYQQQPNIQPAAQKKPWYNNSFGASVTAKPYNRYPGFSSSFTSYGHGSSVTSGSFDKTKQTTQFISTGQYTPTSSGQYKPFSTGQYKPYNWGVAGQQGVQKLSNVYPTSGYIVSTYAPTTFKPFVTSSPFEKSKVSSSFSVTDNKETTYLSGQGSPLSVTTSKPSSFSQTLYKPISGFSSSGEFSEKPKVSTIVVSTTPKYETPKYQLGETHSNEASYLTQNSGSLGISSSSQSSYSSVKPTVDLPTHSSHTFAENSEIAKPTTESPSGTVGYPPNESSLNVEVTKVSESYYTPAPVTVDSPATENKPYSEIYVQSFGSKPYASYTSQNKINEKVQYSSTPKPASFIDFNRENPATVGSFEGESNSFKPTNQPFISTISYYFDKEGPTQISAVQPSNSNKDTLSQNKAENKVQFTQTLKPEWSSLPNHKESFVSSLGGTSYELKPTEQPILSSSSYSYNKEVTPTQFDAKKPSNYGTFSGTTSASFATGSTGFSNLDLSQKQPSQPILSSTNQGDSKDHSVNLASNGGSVGLHDTSNQQSWGFSSSKGTPTQASYVGVFGGPEGILKPNDFGKSPQQHYVQTQYKPSYNNQATQGTQSYPHTAVSSNAASYTGGFGAPAGVLTVNGNVKPNSFGYTNNVNKYASNVQASGFHALAEQNGVPQSQVSAGQQSNAATSASAGGFLNSQQTPFSVGVSSGTGINKDSNKFSGQFSGSKAFGTARGSTGISYGKGLVATLAG